MKKNYLFDHQIEIIKKLSTAIVREISPDEEDFVADAVDDFVVQIPSESHERRGEKAPYEIAFESQDLIQTLTSPAVIAAVTTGLFKIAEIWTIKTKDKAPSQPSKTEKTVQLDPPPSPGQPSIDINYVGVERELIDLFRANGIGADRAKRIAQAFLAIIAKDPSIILKFTRH